MRLVSRPTLRTVRTPCGARPIRSACSLGRVSVPGLGSSGRASTVPFAWGGLRRFCGVRFRAPSCRHSLPRFRARASLSGFLPSSRRSCDRRARAPVQGFDPSTKRCLLVAGRCLLAVDSAPLTDFRRLPRSSASTSRPCSSRRSPVLPRFDPASGGLPLLRFPPLGSCPHQCPVARVHPWRCRVGLRRALTERDRLRRIALLRGGSPSPVCRPTRGSKPSIHLRG